MTIITTSSTVSNVGVDSSSTSTDNHLVRWDGVTGELVQDNGVVTLSDSGIMLGITSLTVDNILIDGNTVEAIGANQTLYLNASGTAAVLINGVQIGDAQNVSAINNLDMTGDLTLSSGDISLDGSIVIDRIGGNATISHKTDLGKSIQDYFKKDGTRMGWLGFGSSGNYDYTIRNETTGTASGDINIQPHNATGAGHVNISGFTHLGIGSPGIKMATVSGTLSTSSTGSITKNLNGISGAKVLSITGRVESSTGVFIPIGYEAGSNNFEWEVWWTETIINLVNNGGSIAGDPYKLLIIFEE